MARGAPPPASLEGDGLAPPPPGRPSLVPRPEVAGAGFNTFDAGTGYVLRTADALTVRLVATGEGNVEGLRAAVQSVAQQVGAISGVALTVAPGSVPDTTPDRAPGTDEILISVDSTSPCGSGNSWAGCGGPANITDSPRAGIRVIHGGRAWVHPQAMGYAAADLGHVVSHELGHTLGLSHYDGVFDGTNQVMHSGSYAAGPTFRSGDANGLRFLHSPLPPQRPANDSFSAAAALSSSAGSVSGSNVDATKETGEPGHAGNAGGASVWYRWTAPSAGDATVDTLGSGFDTLLAVYTGGAVNGLTPVASSDDVDGGLQSRVAFRAVAGTTYRIAVDGYRGASGNVVLHHLVRDPRPANDGFEAARELAGSSGSVRGSNVFATRQPGEPGHAGNAGGASVWYRWRAPTTGTVAVSTRSSDFDTVLAVYRGRALGGLTPVAANDDFAGTLQSRVIFTARAGATYRIAVDGYGGRTGSLRLGYHPR